MKIVLGLGNPGPDYERTRHNVGWWVVDHLADVWRFEGWKKDAQSRVVTGSLKDQRVKLVKPLTYMNLSGAVLRPYLRRENWDASRDLLVVVDEVALPVGSFRIRARGSAGGHNGLKSIEGAVGSQEYARLRVGVGPEDPTRRRGDLAGGGGKWRNASFPVRYGAPQCGVVTQQGLEARTGAPAQRAEHVFRRQLLAHFWISV